MSDNEEDFGSKDQGSNATPMEAGSFKKGQFVMIKGHPCKIMDYSTSKTGKHGHAKVNMTGIDVLTGKKYQEVCPAHTSMQQPNIIKTEYQLIGVDMEAKTISVLDSESETHDFPLEGEVAEKLAAEYKEDDPDDTLVTIMQAPEGDDLKMKELLVSYKKQRAN